MNFKIYSLRISSDPSLPDPDAGKLNVNYKLICNEQILKLLLRLGIGKCSLSTHLIHVTEKPLLGTLFCKNTTL